MKKIIYLLFLTLFVFTSCNQEDETIDITTIKSKQDKFTLCHNGNIITVNGNALKAHLNHGDIQLVDEDGDGWVEMENECVPGGDCDDTNPLVNPGMEEICGNGIDDDCDGEIDEGCRTYVPDDVFENELIRMGYDDVMDDYVLTSNINTIESFTANFHGDPDIKDFTGIQDFIALTDIDIFSCTVINLDLRPLINLISISFWEESNIPEDIDLSNNSLTEIIFFETFFTSDINLVFPNNPSLQRIVIEECSNITSIDLSNNPSLETVLLSDFQYSSLVSVNLLNNAALKSLYLEKANDLLNIDLSINIALEVLNINLLGSVTSLDLSNNSALTTLDVFENDNLNSLNLKNGNNGAISPIQIDRNPNLFCIQVDDAVWSAANWAGSIDSWANFSNDCGY